MNVREYDNREQLLFPPCIGDYLPSDHLAWVIDEVVELLDLGNLYKKVSREGNPCYHPRMMIKVLFYGYANGVFSSRKIEKRVETDVAFIFLSGMQKPNFRTVSDFRKNNLSELKDLFVQIVNLCNQLGMVKLGKIALDSTVIKANVSNDRTYTEEKILKEEGKIKQAIAEYLNKANEIDIIEDAEYGEANRGDELPEEIREKGKRLKKLKEAYARLKEEEAKPRASRRKREGKINLTDHDAKFQEDRGRCITGYRGQVMVDEEKQVIIACEVTNEQADYKQLVPMIDQVEENLDKKEEIPILVADSGYGCGDNFKAIEGKDVDPYIGDGKWEGKRKGLLDKEFGKDKFVYDVSTDTYCCPEGKPLKFKWTKDGGRLYQCNECTRCKRFGKCTNNKNGRTIERYENQAYTEAMRKKLETPEGKEIYRKRRELVEPVIGMIKQNLGFREFLLRGIEKVKGEFALITTAYNLLKIAKYVRESCKKLRYTALVGQNRLILGSIS